MRDMTRNHSRTLARSARARGARVGCGTVRLRKEKEKTKERLTSDDTRNHCNLRFARFLRDSGGLASFSVRAPSPPSSDLLGERSSSDPEVVYPNEPKPQVVYPNEPKPDPEVVYPNEPKPQVVYPTEPNPDSEVVYPDEPKPSRAGETASGIAT